VFVDCDVALDFLAKREPFHGAARDLFVLFELRKVKGFVSPLLYANVSYLLRKQLGRDPALAALTKLSLLVEVVPLSGKAVALALASGLPDFEDALQYYAAQEARISTIVTRNAQHYPRARLTVCSAEQFLAYRAARAPRG
jgi:predicted nucleic acid-binding protein